MGARRPPVMERYLREAEVNWIDLWEGTRRLGGADVARTCSIYPDSSTQRATDAAGWQRGSGVTLADHWKPASFSFPFPPG